jgi:hypothetical protein
MTKHLSFLLFYSLHCQQQGANNNTQITLLDFWGVVPVSKKKVYVTEGARRFSFSFSFLTLLPKSLLLPPLPEENSRREVEYTLCLCE